MHRKSLCSLVLAAAVAGCMNSETTDGGATGDPNIQDPATDGQVDETTLTGVFLDSAVGGIHYTTTTQAGTTNAAGEFLYRAGEAVTFSIGDIALPAATASSVVTPLEVFNTTNLNDTRVVNVARLLQSLDQDGDPSNGITIPDAAHTNASGASLDFSAANFESDPVVTNLVANSGSVTTSLISETQAITHLQENVAKLASLEGSWVPAPGELDGTLVLTFIDGTRFSLTRTGGDPQDGQDGVEVGTYTWNSDTGAFTRTITTDTNGGWGLSGTEGDVSFTSEGDRLIFYLAQDDATITFDRVNDPESLVGGWVPAAGELSGTLVLTFDGTRFTLVRTGGNPADGEDGLEIGTYSWDTDTGAFTSTILVDTNGGWGLSGVEGSISFTLGGDVLTFYSYDSGTINFERVAPDGGDNGFTSAKPQVVVGEYHACGLTSDGVARCWGSNDWGELGDGSDSDQYAPTAVSSDVPFTSLTAGYEHTCGLSGGTAYCWGLNSDGQLGNGDDSPLGSNTPLAVVGGYAFEQIAAGSFHTCGLTENGSAYCWGQNSNGELGNGETSYGSQPQPVAVAGGFTFKSLAAGGRFTCGLTAEGSAYCWGANFSGEVGDGTTTRRETPTAVEGALTFVEIAAGYHHACGFTADGTAYCWGDNTGGGLGDGTTTDRLVPVAVTGGHTFAGLALGTSYTCGLTATGAAYCWGNDLYCQLGNGECYGEFAPVPVAGGHSFVQLEAGFRSTCGITDDGSAFCWGSNLYGNLGDGTTEQAPYPVAVTGELSFLP